MPVVLDHHDGRLAHPAAIVPRLPVAKLAGFARPFPT
jgi:hypothetical protein